MLALVAHAHSAPWRDSLAAIIIIVASVAAPFLVWTLTLRRTPGALLLFWVALAWGTLTGTLGWVIWETGGSVGGLLGLAIPMALLALALGVAVEVNSLERGEVKKWREQEQKPSEQDLRWTPEVLIVESEDDDVKVVVRRDGFQMPVGTFDATTELHLYPDLFKSAEKLADNLNKIKVKVQSKALARRE